MQAATLPTLGCLARPQAVQRRAAGKPRAARLVVRAEAEAAPGIEKSG